MTTTEEDEEPSSPSSSSAVNAQWIANVTLGWQEKLFSPKEETFYQKAKEEDFQVNWTQNVRIRWGIFDESFLFFYREMC